MTSDLPEGDLVDEFKVLVSGAGSRQSRAWAKQVAAQYALATRHGVAARWFDFAKHDLCNRTMTSSLIGVLPQLFPPVFIREDLAEGEACERGVQSASAGIRIKVGDRPSPPVPGAFQRHHPPTTLRDGAVDARGVR